MSSSVQDDVPVSLAPIRGVATVLCGLTLLVVLTTLAAEYHISRNHYTPISVMWVWVPLALLWILSGAILVGIILSVSDGGSSLRDIWRRNIIGVDRVYSLSENGTVSVYYEPRWKRNALASEYPSGASLKFAMYERVSGLPFGRRIRLGYCDGSPRIAWVDLPRLLSGSRRGGLIGHLFSVQISWGRERSYVAIEHLLKYVDSFGAIPTGGKIGLVLSRMEVEKQARKSQCEKIAQLELELQRAKLVATGALCVLYNAGSLGTQASRYLSATTRLRQRSPKESQELAKRLGELSECLYRGTKIVRQCVSQEIHNDACRPSFLDEYAERSIEIHGKLNPLELVES